MAYLTTIFHDMGKFSIEFVKYLNLKYETEHTEYKKINKDTVIHSTQGAKYLYELQDRCLTDITKFHVEYDEH